MKNGISNLAMTIGKVLIPIVTAVLPYINAVIKALQYLFSWIANLLGISIDYSSTGTSSLEDVSDSAEDTSDSLSDASDSAEDLKNNLLGIDELNVIDTESDSSSSSGSSGSAGGVDLTDEIATALEEYEKAWEEAYAGVEDKATKLANKLISYFKNHDFDGLGYWIGQGIAEQLDSIPWDSITSGTEKFGSGLAEFMIGLLDSDMFAEIGDTVAGCVNTVLSLYNGWATTFSKGGGWTKLGNAIAKMVSNTVDGIQWNTLSSIALNVGSGISEAITSFSTSSSQPVKKIGTALGKLFSAGVTFVYSIVSSKEMWVSLGSAIGEGINAFFESMSETDSSGLSGWTKLGKIISDSISGLLTAIITALETANWFLVGQSIGDFISGIDFGSVVWNLTKLIASLLKAIVEAIVGSFEEAPIETALITVIGAFTFSRFASSLAKVLFGKVFGSQVTKYLGLRLATVFNNMTLSASLTSALATFGTLLGWGIVLGISAYIGAKLGETISNQAEDLGGDNSTQQAYISNEASGTAGMGGSYGVSQYTGIGGSFTADNNYTIKVNATWGEVSEGIKNFFENAKTSTVDWVSNVKLSITSKADEVAEKISAFIDGKVKPNIETAMTFTSEIASWLKGVVSFFFGDGSDGKTGKGTTNITFGSVIENWLEGVMSLFFGDGSDGKTKSGIASFSFRETIESWLKGVMSFFFGSGTDGKTGVGSGSFSFASTIESWLKGVMSFFFGDGTDGKNGDAGVTSNIENGIDNWISRVLNFFFGNGKDNTTGDAGIRAEASWKGKTKTALMTLLETIATGGSLVASVVVDIIQTVKTVISGSASTNAEGGFIPNGGGEPKRFASGGIPSVGSLFWAGESGAEIVGHASGGTEVLNESQIATSIASGVERAVANAMLPYLSAIATNTEKTANKDLTVNIGDRDIAKANNRGSKQLGFTLRTS